MEYIAYRCYIWYIPTIGVLDRDVTMKKLNTNVYSAANDETRMCSHA